MKFPNEDIGLMYSIAEKWWGEMDCLKMKVISRKVFSDFAKSKGIINDDREIETILRLFLKEQKDDGSEKETAIRKSSYMKLICIGIMRNLLINLYEFMKNLSSSLGSEEMSFDMKILKL
jgi:hypothetical protein